MNGFKKIAAGLLLSASFMAATGAQAMPIPQFDAMTAAQKGAYSGYLIDSAMAYLRSQGHPDQAEAVRKMFDTSSEATPADHQLVQNLNAARLINQQHANDPNYKPIQVEHVVALTLKQNGIIVPAANLLLAGQNYKPDTSTGTVAHNNGPAFPIGSSR